ncbi:MAG TPA: signal peptide peptidase SppA [Vicinamibacterales bacterium]|nr:signal peptide peptidase SppA [Vicinamibacterales bacterium]
MSSRKGVFLVIFLILAGIAASVFGLVVLALMSGAPATVPANAALYLDIAAPFAEIEASSVLSAFVEPAPTLRQTVNAIKRAKNDTRIKALVIRPRGGGALWAQLQEVRAALDDFRAGGKPITAYLEFGGPQEYFLAAAADRVVMMPAGQLDVAGLAFYELFFRGTLDKLGVVPDLLHIGEYKSASNTFTEKGFTPAHREATQALNRDWYDELVRGIAKGRKQSEAAVRAAIDGGPYLAEAAKKAGLVDVLAYEDQLNDDAPIKGTQKIEQRQYAQAPGGGSAVATGGSIALLYAVGSIASGKSNFDGASQVIGSDTFAEWLRKVRLDSGVRAVVVRIDSPGGSAIASEVIWREMMLTRAVKPLIVSMGDVAASGGYYMAAPAHSIVAQPGTLTGSIGVVTGKFALQGALDKVGVGTATVTEGKHADIYSPFRPFSTEERGRIEEQMQTTYELFLKRVAEGRQVPTEKIDAVAQGRVWTGRQARERGLVDELGGLEDAIRIAKQRARFEPGKDASLIVYPAKRSFYEVLANPFGNGLTMGLEIFFQRPEARPIQSMVETFGRFRRGETLAIMPNLFVR